MRRYRIEYWPLDGWVVLGEPLHEWRRNRHRNVDPNWPVITTVVTREDAVRYIGLVNARQLVLCGMDLTTGQRAA